MLDDLRKLQRRLQSEKMAAFKRRVPFGDLITERTDNAREYGFGEGATCYDSALIIGTVTVGRNTWIGPNVILDGSGGGLAIGDYCAICAGVQIYTHDTVAWSITLGLADKAMGPTRIGNGVFIGPNTIVTRGVTIGDRCVIGAVSLVSSDMPSGKKAWGCPARVVGDAVP